MHLIKQRQVVVWKCRCRCCRRPLRLRNIKLQQITVGHHRSSRFNSSWLNLSCSRRGCQFHLPLRGDRHQSLMRPRVAHRKLARSVTYKQGIQCWASNWQGFVPQVRNEQNNTRHTEVRKSSLRCTIPNTALQSSLRQRSNHCKAPNHAVHTLPEHRAEPRQLFDPNRRPYATERLLFTQALTAT